MLTTANRLRRLLTLDLRVLDEVRLDTGATLPAVLVAGASITFLGLGGWFWWVGSGLEGRWAVLLKSAILGSSFAIAAWIVWLIVAYVVVSRTAKIALDAGALLRSAGFACAPLVLALLMVVRPIAFGIGLTAIGAWVAATQIAIQRTSGRPAIEIFVANIAGFGVWAIVMSLLATATNQTAPGPFLAESIWEAVTSGKVALLP
ncbi:MAG: hypothetical protein WC273_04280 [Dehalococcoidia bacterium]